MQLFEVIPSDFFSVLASPNRELYADALDVLYEAYGDSLRIPESTYYSMLRGRLERQLAQADFTDEDIDEEELRDISGRARFLIRKLGSKGWFEKERGQDFNSFEEYLTTPATAAASWSCSTSSGTTRLCGATPMCSEPTPPSRWPRTAVTPMRK